MIIVCLSQAYLKAIEHDTLDLLNRRNGVDVAVLGTEIPRSIKEKYPDNVLEFNAKVRAVLTGQMVTMNVEVLEYLLDRWDYGSIASLGKCLETLLMKCPDEAQDKNWWNENKHLYKEQISLNGLLEN